MQRLSLKDVRKILQYEEDTGFFYWKEKRNGAVKIGAKAGSPNNDGYIQIKIKGRLYRAHRLAWFYVYGKWPKNEIDHINLDRADNRLSNLRECNHNQNQANGRVYRNNLTGLKGAQWMRPYKKWRSTIRVNGHNIYLGLFDSPEEAHKAYCKAAEFYHREFARLT